MAIESTLANTNWYPSGVAFATRAVPVMPPAPPTFSMITCWLFGKSDRQDAPCRVGGTARGERHDHSDRPRRPVLRRCGVNCSYRCKRAEGKTHRVQHDQVSLLLNRSSAS